MSRSTFSSCLSGGVPFLPEVMVGLDVGDQNFEVDGFLDSDIAFADQATRVAVESPRRLPFYPDHANCFFFAECPPENSGHGYDPRVLYRTAEARLDALGLAPFQGVEYEYRIYRETLRRAGRTVQARACYLRAIALTDNPIEQRFLESRIRALH